MSLARSARFVMGIESAELRWQISQGLLANGNVDNAILVHGDGTALASFAPATHLFSFDFGMPPQVRSCMCEAILRTHTLGWVLLFTPPNRLSLPGWTHVKTYSNLPMAVSGENHSGFLYKREGVVSAVVHQGKSRVLSASRLACLAEPSFKAGFEMAAVPGALKEAANGVSQEFQDAPRKLRRANPH